MVWKKSDDIDLEKVSIAVRKSRFEVLFEEVQRLRLLGCKVVIASESAVSKREIFHNVTLPIEIAVDTTSSAVVKLWLICKSG